LEASELGWFASLGDGIGEYADFSENVVVEDAGDAAPPQPKNVPSLDPPGDLGKGLFVLLESCESLEYVRATPFGMVILCGGVGLVENTDIVAEGGKLVVLKSIEAGPADSDTVVRAGRLNLSSFGKGAGTVSSASARLEESGVGFPVETVTCLRVVMLEAAACSTGSFELDLSQYQHLKKQRQRSFNNRGHLLARCNFS
jgi:hypothetical protein